MKNTMAIQFKIVKWVTVIFILITAAPGWAYSAKSDNENTVRIKVTPQVLSPNKPAQFQIRFNTHSVELDQDLTIIAELHDKQGRTYKAVRWEGSPPGGHHRSGLLTFSKLDAATEEVTLIIRDVADVKERKFTWRTN